jgi:vesicle-fusing ATPase
MMAPEVLSAFGVSHVRGILLHGPPGTGKTLLAREIAKLLNARNTKIVNGPDLIDRYVGESERKIRELFEEAEYEWRTAGEKSELHVIIFDEYTLHNNYSSHA